MTKRPKTIITAKELMDQLNADPEFVQRQQAQEEWIRQSEERSRKEQAPLLSDLASVGVHVQSVWDLVNTKENYPTAISILLLHLHKPYDIGIREGIARALTVREARHPQIAREVFDELLASRGEGEGEFRFALVNALSMIADESLIPDFERILTDPAFRRGRDLLSKTLDRLKRKSTKRKP